MSKVPVFETQLKGLKLTEGEELKLLCKVKSETPITAKWFKDGKEVAADKRVSIKLEPDGTVVLVIAECKPEDAGKYRCEVTNQYGTSPSEADVSVTALKREKPLFINGLKATTFDDGKPGKLEAKVGGFPKPEIQWLKDGKPISDPRCKVETKPDGTTTLKIDDAKPGDAGEYSIVAKNDQGENKSSAPVTVNSEYTVYCLLSGSYNIHVRIDLENPFRNANSSSRLFSSTCRKTFLLKTSGKLYGSGGRNRQVLFRSHRNSEAENRVAQRRQARQTRRQEGHRRRRR